MMARAGGRGPTVIVPVRRGNPALLALVLLAGAAVVATVLLFAGAGDFAHRAARHVAARAARFVDRVTEPPPTPVAPAAAELPVVPPKPPHPDTIELRVTRFTAGSGPVLVSSAVPFAPGAIWPGQSKLVRVYVKGAEQPVYVEELTGRHADGSLRALLVEFTANVALNDPLPGSLVVGQPRQTTDVAKPNPAGRGVPAAAALPTDPAYLLGTGFVGPAVTVSQAAAMGGAFAQYESDFAHFAEQHWAAEKADWASANYYDRAAIYYRWWARTGNTEYWWRGTLMAVAYRDGYMLSPSTVKENGPSAHWAQVEGLAEHYLLTGDERSRLGVGFAATSLSHLMTFGQPAMSYEWDPRIRGRALQAIWLAWRTGAPWVEMPSLAETKTDWRPRLDDALAKVASTVNANGTVRQPVPAEWGCPSPIQSNFMVAVQNDALIRVYEDYRHDARVLPAVKRSLDYMWATQWRAPEQGFAYMSGQCTDSKESQTYTAPDLNNMFVGAFGWVYRQTHDSTYRQRGDQIFAAGVAHAYLVGSKQFNEAYTNSARYLSDRR